MKWNVNRVRSWIILHLKNCQCDFACSFLTSSIAQEIPVWVSSDIQAAVFRAIAMNNQTISNGNSRISRSGNANPARISTANITAPSETADSGKHKQQEDRRTVHSDQAGCASCSWGPCELLTIDDDSCWRRLAKQSTCDDDKHGDYKADGYYLGHGLLLQSRTLQHSAYDAEQNFNVNPKK